MISKERYLEHVRGLPCCVCLEKPAEPNHVLSGGVSMKGSDFGVVPMCRKHHDEYHNRGKLTFQEEHSINIYEAIARTLAPYLENLSKRRYVVTQDGDEYTVVPGGSFETVWDIALNMEDCDHVQLTSLGKVVGVLDPKNGWSARHEIKIELLED